MNACIECCDRHAEGDAVALYCEAQDGRAARYTFRELQAHAAGFGNFLREQGVKPGDRVATRIVWKVARLSSPSASFSPISFM
ncbi:AMP-binding protein [Pseudomonas sp. W5-01]|uniref:AMP-binding protein n=1 Tax=Pseudomonas sp. W5-01 TaxID=3097454 RepID=UPI00397A7DE4